MGDRKPKKNSSGNSDSHKAKVEQTKANRPPTTPATESKPKRPK